ncbi:Na+/H+ antiporter subunit E [Pseudomonas kuykendallii]|uniref:Na+/H+ antiporter subunit E n=1 Tax=Pseudomonas kuykendallii TaxID=1007099 RepID=A0A2W5D2V5_9PSED|nr:Na+/H+ antiporter subunit E [Pseudomonas kuykendallii]PZP23687.1 MAG: Na+/H+ antiporter subunit E [Pseudomonas kuykendallii]
MKRLLPQPGLSLLLIVMWLLLTNSLALGQLLLGGLLGVAIPLLCRPFLLEVPPVRKPVKLVSFALLVLYDIVIANLHVARLVLGRRDRLRPAFVEVPIEIRDEFVLAVLSSVLSLTPGTVSAGLSPDHSLLLLHVLDLEDADDLVAQVKSRYEAPLLEIFECSPT